MAPPWVYGLIKAKRPAGAKALIINAFALTGRAALTFDPTHSAFIFS